MSRNRRIKYPCIGCGASPALCLCGLVPRIELRTRISLVVHHRELRRSSNTGVLAMRALVNGEIRVRGKTVGALDLSDLLTPEYRSFLFYPSEDAVELSRGLVEQDPSPIHLIIPDGTWRQARKVHYRHPELTDLPRVKISTPQNMFQLRAQSRPERMATLPAIARALGIIEGAAIEAQLMSLYQAKVERTLMARGLLKTSLEQRAPA